MSNLYWLNDAQMDRLRPFFPKSRGRARVDGRRVLSGIIFINRNGLRWCDAPVEYGPLKTLYNRWKRWSDMCVFARIMMGLAEQAPNNKTISIPSCLIILAVPMRSWNSCPARHLCQAAAEVGPFPSWSLSKVTSVVF
jgi:transposase